MMSVWLTILGYVEVLCPFDAAQYGTSLQALRKEGIVCRTRTINFSSASRRTAPCLPWASRPTAA